MKHITVSGQNAVFLLLQTVWHIRPAITHCIALNFSYLKYIDIRSEASPVRGVWCGRPGSRVEGTAKWLAKLIFQLKKYLLLSSNFKSFTQLKENSVYNIKSLDALNFCHGWPRCLLSHFVIKK
jgi:hypothetical protein